MAVICPVCASPSLRGQVDADVVRRLTLSSIAQKHGLSSRAIRRHVGHLPEKLEGEAAASSPRICIGSVNYDISLNVVVVDSDEEEEGAGEAQTTTGREGVAANEAMPGN